MQWQRDSSATKSRCRPTLAGIHAALAYYHANREQIDAEIDPYRIEAARLEAELARAPKVA